VIPTQRQFDLLGKQVRVTNPHLDSSWKGELVGFADHPTLLLEAYDGHQMSLPQSFTIEVIDAVPASESGGTVSNLPPFSGDDVPCPKCGKEGCSTEWVSPNFVGPGGTRGECLERRCRRCTHAWGEATVEQKPPVIKETT
jgi:hypothetical protein